MAETMSETVEPDTGESGELDDDEQAEVEQAEHDQEHNPEPDESDPAEHTPPVGEAEVEKMWKALARSATTWRNRVSTVMGEDAQLLVPCELCEPDIPGFHWPPGADEARDEVHARLLAVLTAPEEPTYNAAPHAKRCETCDGWGKVASGSRDVRNVAVVCPTCSGAGYVKLPGYGPAEPTNGSAPEVVPVAPGAELPREDVDGFGIARLLPDGQENPNYGRSPMYWDARFPTGSAGEWPP